VVSLLKISSHSYSKNRTSFSLSVPTDALSLPMRTERTLQQISSVNVNVAKHAPASIENVGQPPHHLVLKYYQKYRHQRNSKRDSIYSSRGHRIGAATRNGLEICTTLGPKRTILRNKALLCRMQSSVSRSPISRYDLRYPSQCRKRRLPQQGEKSNENNTQAPKFVHSKTAKARGPVRRMRNT
jgi:hypothetical protein